MDFVYSLIEVCLSHGEGLLKTDGGFLPFARLVHIDGQIDGLEITNELKSASSHEINARLEDDLSKIDKHSIALVAICSDIHYKTEATSGNAFLVRIDASTGQSMDVLIPYEQRENSFFYGQMIQQAGSLRVFER